MKHLDNETDTTQRPSRNRGFGEAPFPKAGPSRALRDEDAFMERHGGFCLQEALLAGGRTLRDMLLSVVKATKTPDSRTAVKDEAGKAG